MQEINVEEIMQGIRKEIAEKHYEDVEYKFRDVHLRLNCVDAVYDKEEFIANLDKAKPHAIVNAYKPLYGNPISKIIKKINRKLIAFYVESVVDDQNDYNIYTHRAIAMLPDRFQDTDERLFELEKKLAKCEKTIEELKSQLEK